MKKITLIATLFIALITSSCSRESQIESNDVQTSDMINNLSSGRSSHELANILKSDEDFLKLASLSEIVVNVSDKENYINNFNAETLESSADGNEYLASISGYDKSVIADTNTILTSSLSNLQSKYPELIPNGYNQEFITETINEALEEDSVLSKKSCKDCAREGRANMVAGTLLGAATGSAWGFYGGWAGAVVGFWAAGEQTVSCLRAAGC